MYGVILALFFEISESRWLRTTKMLQRFPIFTELYWCKLTALFLNDENRVMSINASKKLPTAIFSNFLAENFIN